METTQRASTITEITPMATGTVMNLVEVAGIEAGIFKQAHIVA
jgi:hypothetical protein